MTRPLVLGHRGASAAEPENTLAAFAKAREMGADGVELDVRRTSDGVLVVHHDAEIPGFGFIVSQPFGALRETKPSIPTLDEALDELDGLLVNVELKCLPWEPDADGDGEFLRGVMRALEPRSRAHLVVSSFHIGAIDAVRAIDETLTTAWLTHGREARDGAQLAHTNGHAWLHPDRASVLGAPAGAVGACHGLGLRIDVWTVDDPDEIAALARAGVDAIITNVPDVALTVVA